MDFRLPALEQIEESVKMAANMSALFHRQLLVQGMTQEQAMKLTSDFVTASFGRNQSDASHS